MYFPLIDIAKLIFAIFIFLHHAEINLLVKQGILSSTFGTSYLAVEGFLLISGFFIASSVARAHKKIDYKTYFSNRTLKIYPPVIVTLFIYLLFNIIISALGGQKFFSFFDLVPSILLLGDVFVGKQIVGFWYLPILFWGGALLAYLLFNCSKHAIVIFPFFAICGYAWIFHQFGGLPLHTEPYIGGPIVGGTLRGISGLSLGISIYLFKDKLSSAILKFNVFLLTIGVCISAVMACKLLLRDGPTNRDFQIIFYLSFLLLAAINFKIEILMRYAPLCKWLGKLSYYIFLLHILIFDVMVATGINSKLVVEFRILVSFIATVICSCVLVSLEKNIIAGLRRFVLVI